MSGEEHSLPVELGRLEIESGKGSNSILTGDENPFQRRSNGRSNSATLFGSKCNHCNNTSTKKSTKSKVTFKRTNGKLLKDPVLKYVNYCQSGSGTNAFTNSLTSVSLSPANRSNNSCRPREDVHTLVSGCSQMRISTEGSGEEEVIDFNQNSDLDRVNNSSGGLVACSQQALNPPCDVTIDELACYFETLVHIPKKMSSMAEMMYI